MRIDVITVFPEYLKPLDLSLIGKAKANGLVDIQVHDLRKWAYDNHKTVDDTPYGGGAGMVMKADVWGSAIDDIVHLAGAAAEYDEMLLSRRYRSGKYGDAAGEELAQVQNPIRLIIPTPCGRLFTQRDAERLVHSEHVIFACGRYEGIDSRVSQYYQRQNNVLVQEYSIGDYVLNGGEVAALVMIEAITRLIPGVIGNPQSLAEESHNPIGLLEYPMFTKPQHWRGFGVPDVLLSGNHQKIADWRLAQSQKLTKERRPDLLG